VKAARKPMFEPGDLVTGKDRSYKRSIYKILSSTEDPDIVLVEFQSLGYKNVQMWKDNGASQSSYQFFREYSEFRLATRQEIDESSNTKTQYALIRLLKKLGMVTDTRFDY
jgi:hypothetical protein